MTDVEGALGRAGATVSALARACHPAPTVAVTVFATVLAVTAGNPAGTCALLAAAVLAGQLSIGWSNDRLDAARDLSVGRTDKPLAQGELTLRGADTAIAAALAATIVFSLALGWRAGLLHLFAVACGWIYNLGVKSTWWSWLAYAAAFGALPGVATFALAAHPAPAPWVVAAGALLGITANLTNPLPELDADEATGIRGLAHRLGARPSLLLAAVLAVAASVLIISGPAGAPQTLAWVGLAVDIAAAAVGLRLAWPRPASHVAFYGLMGVVAINVVLIALIGDHLH
ncbi:MAG TPA: UbiA family prenyltransferase [Jatrophihabitans sp.]|nr:UbiA family prenyltransferase [Jatrophihabitans sp.]